MPGQSRPISPLHAAREPANTCAKHLLAHPYKLRTLLGREQASDAEHRTQPVLVLLDLERADGIGLTHDLRLLDVRARQQAAHLFARVADSLV
jgi:hypothetical protein